MMIYVSKTGEPDKRVYKNKGTMNESKLWTFDEFLTEGKKSEIPFDKGTKVILKRDYLFTNDGEKNTIRKVARGNINSYIDNDLYWVTFDGTQTPGNNIGIKLKLKYGKDF